MPRSFQVVGFQLALAAILLRALLPPGWMPNPSIGSNSPFIICTVDGISTSGVAAHGAPNRNPPNQGDGRLRDVCAYACAVHFVSPIAKVTVAPPNLRARTDTCELAPTCPTIARYTQQSPRAPPSLI